MSCGCKKKIKNLIKSCDIIGTFITFRIKEEEEYKSLIGGCSIIIFMVGCLSYIIFMAIPFIKRENVEVIYANKLVNSNPIVDFRGSDFNFAFGITFSDFEKETETPALEETENYFNYTIKERIWNGDTEQVDVPLRYKHCEITSLSIFLAIGLIVCFIAGLCVPVPAEVHDEFEVNSLGSMLCLDQSSAKNFTLNGLFTDDYLKYLMEDLSAKVFRTFNASFTLQDQLNKKTFEHKESIDEKVAYYNEANKQVAILCNHQKTVPKNYNIKSEMMQKELEEHVKYLEELNDHLKVLKGGSAKKKKSGK